MITVTIFINGSPVYSRSAVNRGKENENGETEYELDSHGFIRHLRADAAIDLAKQMLDTIKELK